MEKITRNPTHSFFAVFKLIVFPPLLNTSALLEKRIPYPLHRTQEPESFPLCTICGNLRIECFRAARVGCCGQQVSEPGQCGQHAAQQKTRFGQNKSDGLSTVAVLALPIFPGRRQPSIVGRNELNYRVRNGNGWTLILISTNSLSIGFSSEEQTVL